MTALGNPLTVDSITVRGLDTSDTLRSDIASVSLYRDDGNGMYGPEDMLVGAPAAFSADASGTGVTFNDIDSVVTPGTPAAFWVVYTIGPSPGDGHEIGSQVLATDVTVANATVLPFSPIISANGGNTIDIDTSPPVTSATGVPPGWSNAATVTLTATDTGSGVAQTYYTIDGGVPQLYSVPLAITAEGTTTVAYWSVDNVGNIEMPKTATVLIDASGPSAPVVTASVATTVAIDVSWTPSTDSLSGLDHYSLFMANGTLVTTTTATAYRVTGLASATSYGFYVRAYDVAGNATQSNTATATTLDATPPTTTLTYPPPNGNAGWWTVAPSVSATTSKPAVTYYNFNSPGPPWDVLGTTITPPEGISTLYYFSSDGMALPEPTRSVRFKVDTQPPPSPEASAAPGPSFSINVTWNAVTDPTSGLANYKVSRSTGELVGQTSQTSYHVVGLSAATTYGFQVKAYDVAGNVSASNIASATTLGNSVSLGPTPPHVATTSDTDVCAMCHRVHTSAAQVPTGLDVSGGRANALVVGTIPEGSGDVLLCYTCHGLETLGSMHDVESEFTSGPGHSLTPSASPFGPTYKECSDCHDSHGSAKTASGTPYPALLRARDASGNFVYSGDTYCTTCHTVRAGSEFPGYSVWRLTAHAGLPGPASGTDINCSICHTPHASAIQPNIVGTIAPPAVLATMTVPANDRRFCVVCHSDAERTWEGTSTFAASAHGASLATVSIQGEWAAPGASRRVGECQSCHAPMGASDGHGGVIPDLLQKAGAPLCYKCHGPSGPAKTDLQSIGYKPVPVVSLLAAYDSGSQGTGFGDLELFTRDSTATTTLTGPRSYLSGRVGAMAVGDVDGEGGKELVVGRTGTSRVTVLSHSPFEGLAPLIGDRTLLAPATYLAVADVLDDVDNRAELITADGDTVRVYRWNTLSQTFDSITATTLPGTITGLAAGDILGGTHADLAVTTNAPDRLVVLTQGTPTSLSISGSYPTHASPCGPSIGDINNDGHGEIAVANAGELSPTLSVYGDDGTDLMDGGSTTDASPTATAIGNVLPGVTEPGTSGDEIALALGSTSGAERVEVFARSGSGLAAPQSYDFPAHSDPDALAMGDVDGDGRSELVVGLGGLFSTTPTSATAPGVGIIHASSDGTTIGTVDVLSAGGVQLAGSTVVLCANLGSIGPSRHPVEAAVSAHVSTETAPFPEHVSCDDCHNVHAATDATAAAPALPGVEQGAWGVSMSGPVPVLLTGVTQEYELCFKCHASYGTWTPLSGVSPVASQFDPDNASFHPVEAPAKPTNAVGQTLATPLVVGSRITCSDCHGNSAGRGSSPTGEPNGPHSSPSAPLLVKPVLGTSADDIQSLCYSCHLFGIYGNGNLDDTPTQSSGFVNPSGANPKLHAYHTSLGLQCSSCHVAHGSASMPYGLRDDVGWTADTSGAGGGECTNGCHGGASKTYHR